MQKSMSEQFTITEYSNIKKGMFVVYGVKPNQRPCKVIEVFTSKPGKHGTTKVRITCVDIFTKKKSEIISPGSSIGHIPIITKKDYILTHISDDNYLGLMDETGFVREDLILPDNEDGKKIKTRFEQDKNVSIQTTIAFDEEHVTSFKIIKD